MTVNALKIVFSLLLSFLFTIEVHAQDYSNPPAADEIIVESRQDLTAPYKERRSNFGLLFSLNYEKFYPEEHASAIQNKPFKQISDGQELGLVGAELGLKYNFILGSIAGVIGYAKGNFSNEAQNLEGIEASIMKAGINLTLDNLMSEPWVAPYAQAGVHQIDWTESSYSGSDLYEETLKSKPNFHYKVGLLFQLNWIEKFIDPMTSVDGLRSSGLENTFIDVFYTQYAAYADSEDSDEQVNLSSSAMGVGLKLEF
ncbi:MAG: hypothetical protein ACK41T_08650 [Pseudobdellovibrio sp.]